MQEAVIVDFNRGCPRLPRESHSLDPGPLIFPKAPPTLVWAGRACRFSAFVSRPVHWPTSCRNNPAACSKLWRCSDRTRNGDSRTPRTRNSRSSCHCSRMLHTGTYRHNSMKLPSRWRNGLPRFAFRTGQSLQRRPSQKFFQIKTSYCSPGKRETWWVK